MGGLSRGRRLRRLVSVLVLAAAASGMALAAVQGNARLHDLQARRAWEVRRGDLVPAQVSAARTWGLRGGDLDLLDARALYLQGDFQACLDALGSLPEDDASLELRREAEDCFMADLPWPELLVSARRLDLRGSEEDLVRVVEAGPGERDRLEVFGRRDGRFRPLPLRVARPSGELLREDALESLPLGDVEKVESADLAGGACLLVWHVREGRPLLDVLAAPEGRLTSFRFDSGKKVRREGSDLVETGTAWRWRDGRFETR